MSLGLEIAATSSATAAADTSATTRPQRVVTHTKVFTPYPYANTFVNAGENGDILPYMANVHSPVRVTYTPGPSLKRKSRVSDLAKSAVFNFRPLQRGDRPMGMLRFKAPDATSPTLQFLSPWVSVTKLEFKDPQTVGVSEESDARDILPPGLFRRSLTDSEIASRNGTTFSQIRGDSDSVTKMPMLQNSSRVMSRAESQSNTFELRSSLKSGSTDKRVTIVDPSDCLIEMDSADIQPKPYVSSPAASPKTRMKNIKYPDNDVNYYSGYLPPELSDKIASDLELSNEKNADDGVAKKDCMSMFRTGSYYKPLIGDRSLFIRETYPVQPKVQLSDLEKLRFAGHERLVQTNGQLLTHFSTLKDKGTLKRPSNRGRLDEAVRRQQRLAKSATSGGQRLPAQGTSLEQFQRQRDRTYFLQDVAKEMINK